MKLVALAAAIAALSLAAAPADAVDLTRASEGYTYFNRPGADMTAVHRELKVCIAVIVPFARDAPSSYGPIGGAIGAIMSGGVRGAMDAAALENCMVVRGWRVVRLGDTEGAALARLDRASLAGQLSAWVGLDVPHGQVLRRWENDAARPDTIKTSMPGMTSRPSLSLLSAPETLADPPPPLNSAPPGNNKGFIFRAAEPESLGVIPPGSGLLVVTVKNTAPKATAYLRLQRLSPDPKQPIWATDKEPYALTMVVPKKMPAGPAGSLTKAYVVPAGRWALAGVSDLLNFCMGAPFFTVKAGDVIHIGSIDFGVDGLPIDPDPAPAVAHLARSPLRDRVQPAAWRNGATFPCGGYEYALEYPQLPYEPGYARAGTPAP
jgi:hypothetical protein